VNLTTQAVLCVSMAGVLSACADRGPFTTGAAARHVDRTVTVCGTVIDFTCAAPDWATYFTLDTPESSPAFAVEIARTDRVRFGPQIEERYYAHRLCATGKIEMDARGLRIVANRPDQLAVGDGFRPAQLRSFPGAYRPCDDGVQPPVNVRTVQPAFPSDAMLARTEGQVRLQGVVDTNGSVRDIQVLRSLGPQLDVEAVKAFSAWTFTPATRNGQAVPMITTAFLSFAVNRR
jgi:TonB family protein